MKDELDEESNLTACDLEPITRMERIQSFGFLLALSGDWTIVRASANLETFLGVAARLAIGRTLDSLVDADALHDLRNRLTGLQSTGGTERLYDVALIDGLGRLDLAVHYAGSLCILEGEPAGIDSRLDAASLVQKLLARLARHPTLEAFHGDASRQIRSITGFDRVMIYRFLQSGAGEVIAESTDSGNDSFIGLHYPASDIPVQARALYLRNAFRIIADVDAPTSPVLAAAADGVPLDLSLAMTRAVSPVHLEYLRNMGVGASLSISIIVDGSLWGLIACHHRLPRLPTFIVRTAAELLGQMYSMALESRIRRAQDAEDSDMRGAVQQLLAAITADITRLSRGSWLLDALRPLIHCDGIAVTWGGRRDWAGTTLSAADIDAVAATAAVLPNGVIFATESFAGHPGRPRSSSARVLKASGTEGVAPAMPGVDGVDGHSAVGVLCIPLSDAAADFVMLFRRPMVHEIRWAGDPTKTPADGAGVRMSPRKSFAAFSESVAGRSRSFTVSDRRVAESLRRGFEEVLHRASRPDDGERQRVTERQELLIAELNHRVRNVLSLIRGLISQTHGEAGDAASYVRSLSGRVQALARAHDRVTRQNWGPGPLNAIFDDEISAYVPTRRDRFLILGEQVLLHPQAFSTCALIIHELVTNCSKYGSLSDSGRVEVTLEHRPGDGLHLHWQEHDGPLVQPPTRRGFGSVIIERVVPFDLQGTASVRYLPAGLQAEFFIPERHIAPRSARQDEPHSVGAAHPPACGIAPAGARPLYELNVLLLEDNLIVAMEAEDLLRALGAANVYTASTTAGAGALLEAEDLQFAVLDINLGFERSLDFGGQLRAAGVPFIFTSGYGDSRRGAGPDHRELTVTKPYDQEQLGLAIKRTLDSGMPAV